MQKRSVGRKNGFNLDEGAVRVMETCRLVIELRGFLRE